MKNIALIFLISIAFAACKSSKNQQFLDSNVKTKLNSIEIESTPIAENPLPPLTQKQQKQLDERIPPEIREILDKSAAINIYYNINEQTKGLRVLGEIGNVVPNAGAILSEASLKKRFLENFYYDASLDESGAMCYNPRQKLTAQYNNKTVELDICYQCGNFKGKSSDGNFSGAFAYIKKSEPIMNEIIEKYGTALK